MNTLSTDICPDFQEWGLEKSRKCVKLTSFFMTGLEMVYVLSFEVVFSEVFLWVPPGHVLYVVEHVLLSWEGRGYNFLIISELIFIYSIGRIKNYLCLRLPIHGMKLKKAVIRALSNLRGAGE